MGNHNSGDISHYTIDKANIIIEALASGLQPITAAEMAGICRATAFNWRNQYPDFAARWEDAKASATERVEEVVWRHAVSGNLPASFYWLRHNKPQTYNREALAKVAMLHAAIQSQAAKGGGRLTITIDANGIPQIAENPHQSAIKILMPDNGRSNTLTDVRVDPPPEPEPSEQQELALELPASPPAVPEPQAETDAQVIERYSLQSERPPLSQNVYALN